MPLSPSSTKKLVMGQLEISLLHTPSSTIVQSTGAPYIQYTPSNLSLNNPLTTAFLGSGRTVRKSTWDEQTKFHTGSKLIEDAAAAPTNHMQFYFFLIFYHHLL